MQLIRVATTSPIMLHVALTDLEAEKRKWKRHSRDAYGISRMDKVAGYVAVNDNAPQTWGEDDTDQRVTISHDLQARLAQICHDVVLDLAGWDDAGADNFLGLIGAGHTIADARAVLIGDAVLKGDGTIDYDPGCSWVDTFVDLPLNVKLHVHLNEMQTLVTEPNASG